MNTQINPSKAAKRKVLRFSNKLYHTVPHVFENNDSFLAETLLKNKETRKVIMTALLRRIKSLTNLSHRMITDSPLLNGDKDVLLQWSSGGVAVPHPKEWVAHKRGSFQPEFKLVEQSDGVVCNRCNRISKRPNIRISCYLFCREWITTIFFIKCFI